MVEFLKEAARVVPSKRQLDWFEMERYAFVHYGVNTYTDREWGEGTEDEKICLLYTSPYLLHSCEGHQRHVIRCIGEREKIRCDIRDALHKNVKDKV